MSNKDSLAAQRLARLLDQNSFVELGSLVTARSTDFNLKEQAEASDGVMTGHGLIDGNLVFVYSQDVSVLNGTIGEMHARKIAGVYDMAMKMGAPVIGFLDCAGIRLQESVDALSGLGKIYRKMAQASGVIPQIAAVFGECGGGLSVVPAMCDFCFMEAEHGKLFLNSPNAIEGNHVDKCDTSASKFQSEETGNIDLAGTEDEILTAIRTLIPMLPDNNSGKQLDAPTADDLNRACQSMDVMKGDARYLAAELSDDHVFFETKKDFAKGMVTGFVRLNGTTVGMVANATEIHDGTGEKTDSFDAVLNARGVEKAASFVNFCDAFEIPVLTLVNTKGFCNCMCAEKRLARELGTFTVAYANATVPKVTLVVGEAYGSAGVLMASKQIGADLVYAWPSAKIGMMAADLAAKIMYPDADASTFSEKAKEYDALQDSALTAAKRGYVDLLVEPQDTRKYLIDAFEMLYTKRMDVPFKKHSAK